MGPTVRMKGRAKVLKLQVLRVQRWAGMRGARDWPRRPLVWFHYTGRVKTEVAVMDPLAR